MIPVRDNQSSRGLAPVSVALILVNLAVFMAEIHQGERFLRSFSVSPHDLYLYLTAGTGGFFSLHRSILVAGFMHAGWVHLMGNLLFLFVFGPAVEGAFGRPRFALFYLLSIPVAFYAHTVMQPHSPVPVVGASGAIAAVIGAYLVFYPRARIVTILPLLFIIRVVEVPSLIFILGWFALQGANGYLSIGQASGVAWFSHIGGFLLGVGCGVHHRWFR